MCMTNRVSISFYICIICPNNVGRISTNGQTWSSDKLLRIIETENWNGWKLLHLTQPANNFNNIYTSVLTPVGNIFGLGDISSIGFCNMSLWSPLIVIVSCLWRGWMGKNQPLSVCLHSQRLTLVQPDALLYNHTTHLHAIQIYAAKQRIDTHYFLHITCVFRPPPSQTLTIYIVRCSAVLMLLKYMLCFLSAAQMLSEAASISTQWLLMSLYPSVKSTIVTVVVDPQWQ